MASPGFSTPLVTAALICSMSCSNWGTGLSISMVISIGAGPLPMYHLPPWYNWLTGTATSLHPACDRVPVLHIPTTQRTFHYAGDDRRIGCDDCLSGNIIFCFERRRATVEREAAG